MNPAGVYITHVYVIAMHPYCVAQEMREVRLRDISLHDEDGPDTNHPKISRRSQKGTNCINWAHKDRDCGVFADDRDDAEHKRRAFSYQFVPHTADRRQEDGEITSFLD